MDGVPFRIVTAIGFPVMTFPEILESLHSMPFPMRYTVRFLPLDQVDATKLMGKIRDKWFGSRTPSFIVKHWCFDFKETLSIEVATDFRNDF